MLTTYTQMLDANQLVVDGLLFIPDISGFTELVHSTDLLTGQQIIYELLCAVIGQNKLDMNMAEVEGDAVLYYRYGAAPALTELVEQYEKMFAAFERKRAELEKRFSRCLTLSLKVIAHYGPMIEYSIGSFKKLYGEVVVESHRLLKNSIDSECYLLLTDTLLRTNGSGEDNESLLFDIRFNKLCELYGTTRNICFTYFDYSKQTTSKQVA